MAVSIVVGQLDVVVSVDRAETRDRSDRRTDFIRQRDILISRPLRHQDGAFGVDSMELVDHERFETVS